MQISSRPDLAVVRGKFYIYTSNAADAPLNSVPNFRLRVTNEDAVLASNSYVYANTGRTAPPQEPYYGLLNDENIESHAGQTLRPSSNPLKPSLYSVDLMPILVPAAVGSNIGATFESYSTEDPANATLSLTEFSLSSYSLFTSSLSTTNILEYAPDPIFASTVMFDTVPSVHTITGAFNAENDFRPGRRQALDLPDTLPSSGFATIAPPADSRGIIMDTQGVPADRFGIGILSVACDNTSDMPRIYSDKMYLGLFNVSSDAPAEPVDATPAQGGIQFQLQTAGGAVTSRLELGGPANFAAAGSRNRQILDQVLPGSQCYSPLTAEYPYVEGERGGTYVVVLPSPLDPDIRRDNGGSLAPLISEPGYGVSAPSFRDLVPGINVVSQPTTLRLSDSLVVPWAPPNRAKYRINGIIVGQVDKADDGGYGY
jgi:hypothetical protein